MQPGTEAGTTDRETGRLSVVLARAQGWVLALPCKHVVEVMRPLLLNARRDLIATIGILDRTLLLVLQAGALVPEDVWRSLEAHWASV